MFILTGTEKLCDRQQLRELTASGPVLQTVINALKCRMQNCHCHLDLSHKN